MSLYTFKINGSTQDLGIISKLGTKRIVNKFVVPPIADGDAPEIIKMGESYRQIDYYGRFIGTEAEIGAFLTAMENAEKNGTQCTITSRFSIFTDNNCFVFSFDYDDNAGTPGYIDYTLTLNEGSSIL